MRSVWQKSEVRGGGSLIFVTVGAGNDLGFDRLVRAMEKIAEEGEEVVIQIGCSVFVPKTARWFRYGTDEQLTDLYSRADIIVAHAGAGTLISTLLLEKPLVVVPRLPTFGEIDNNHQIELAEALESTGDAIAVLDIRSLMGAIEKARSKAQLHEADNTALVGYLKDTLAKMTG